MVTDPDRYIDTFAEAGASMISVHVEVLPHLHRTIHAIKRLGCQAGSCSTRPRRSGPSRRWPATSTTCW